VPPFAPGAILAALREPFFRLGLGQQCCLFSDLVPIKAPARHVPASKRPRHPCRGKSTEAWRTALDEVVRSCL
jgi:hypothetical protein